jgi:uncharacterized protein (DUF4415 family)
MTILPLQDNPNISAKWKTLLAWVDLISPPLDDEEAELMYHTEVLGDLGTRISPELEREIIESARRSVLARHARRAQSVTLRIPWDVLSDIKEKAEKEGIGYQTWINRNLRELVK